MSVRSTQALVLAGLFTFGAAGCSSGGGSSPSSSAPAPVAGMAEGIQPSDNDFTKQAELLLLQEDFQAALDAANQSITSEPDNAQGYVQAGRAQLGLGDVAGASESFTKAEELYPSFGPEMRAYRETAWVQAYNDAISEYQAGNLEAAMGHFETGHAIYKDRPEAMLQLGSMYSNSGRTEDAIRVYQEAIALTTGPLLAEQDSAGMAEWAESENIAALNLGQLYAQNEQPGEASRVYSEYLNRHPGDITTLSNLGATLVMAEQADSAMAIYDQILARTDLNAREYFVTGVGLYNVEAYDRAATAFSMSAELNPLNRDAQFNLAQTLYLDSQFEGLYDEAVKLIELDPNNQQAYVLAYQGLKETGRESEGNALIQRADELSFLVEVPTLQPIAGGGAVLSGEVKNVQLDEGSPIVIRVHFTGMNGQELGVEDVTVMAPAADMTTQFSAEINATVPVVGYWYEVVS